MSKLCCLPTDNWGELILQGHLTHNPFPFLCFKCKLTASGGAYTIALGGWSVRFRLAPYVLLLVIAKFFRAFGLFLSYDTLKLVPIVPFLFIVKAGSSIILVLLQRPISAGKKVTRNQWMRVIRHGIVGSAINLLWLFGLTLCGPARTILIFEHSDIVIIAALGALFTGGSGKAKMRGATLFIFAIICLLLFDVDTHLKKVDHRILSSEGHHRSPMEHLFYSSFTWFGVSDHKGGVLLLLLTLLVNVAYKSAARKLSVDIGGAKRLNALSTSISAVVLSPWALFILATQGTVSVAGLAVNLIGIFAFRHAHTHAHGKGGCSHGNSQSHGHSHNHNHHGHSHSKQHGHGHEHEPEPPRQNRNMEGVFLHVLADTLGSVGVIVSSLLIDQYGLLVADPVCSIFIASLIFISVLPLLKESSLVLLQRTPHHLENKLAEGLDKFVPFLSIVLFVFIFDYYVESVSVTRLDSQKTSRFSSVAIICSAVFLIFMWSHPITSDMAHMSQEVQHRSSHEHIVTGGLIFSSVLFIIACRILSAPLPKSTSKGSFIGYDAGGHPLYSFAGDALHKTSQSIITVSKNILRQVLAEYDSRQIFYFLCINLMFTFVELTYGVWTNSLGLISDGFHMLFDCTALNI
uniref:Zinc transporter 5-like n=1 Tax=Saccoglossus kowalevskii TaxID=10224 RepID=A0ABM0MG07_SACKO|nr:PREDICTED: zinc transporter 5-like [Saccoglossus kowalevskii]